MAKRPLPRRLVEAINESKPGVDTSMLLKELVDVWGGPRALVKDIRDEFLAAPAGGQTRQRTLDMIQRLVVNATNDGAARVRPPSELTNDELRERLSELFDRISDGREPKT